MNATNLTYNDAGNGYLSNVAAAARHLIAALLAVKPRPAEAAGGVISQRSKEDAYYWLNNLANDCERHSPGLSAELRFMASRG